jgi:hypothetical protein
VLFLSVTSLVVPESSGLSSPVRDSWESGLSSPVRDSWESTHPCNDNFDSNDFFFKFPLI